MSSLGKTFKQSLKGCKGTYIVSFIFQFFMVLSTVFTMFLSKVLVDTLSNELDKAEYIEAFVVYLLTGSRGPEYLSNNLYILPVAIIIAAFATAIISFFRFYYRVKASNALTKSLQLALFDHLNKVPYGAFRKEKTGDLIQTCTRDIQVARKFMVMDMSQLTYTTFVVVLCFSILMEISWKLTLVSLSLMPIMFVYSFFLIKEVRRRYRAVDDSEAMMVDKISQNLNGVRIIKAYNGENKEIKGFASRLLDYELKFKKHRRLAAFFFGSTDIFIFTSRVLALVYSLYLVFQGEISAGTVFISYTFVNMMVWPLRNTATTLSNLGETLAASDRIQKLLGMPQEDLYSGLTPKITGDIEFKNVTFGYPDMNGEAIIHDISFHIKAGQTVALMGKTGSGKSSLSSLLLRLYDPDKGNIYLDGVDIQDISLHHLRQNVAPVLQDPFLFSKTISDNIAIAKPLASEEEIKEAARIASIDSSIASFEEGYDTQVGEKGVTLSGGQKQRVAIARTVISKAPVLVFDDSLSAVDAETDLSIRSQLKRFSSSSTILIVTHRIMTAKDCDLIMVLEEGRITEMGKHEELIRNNGLYARIAKIQSADE